MAFAIKATFLLGFYQGRTTRGGVEAVPTPARLHAALVAGAYSRQRQVGASLDELDNRVFDWLEDNAPSAIWCPDTFLNSGPTIVFRNKGEVAKVANADIRHDAKKKACEATGRTALSGPVVWYWENAPEPDVRKRVCEIVAEVPYLGEACCPVVFGVDEDSSIPEDALMLCAPSFDATGLSVAVRGRHKVLEEAYKASKKTPRSRPSKGKEVERPSPVAQELVDIAYYAQRKPVITRSPAPWTTGYVLAVTNRTLSPDEYLMWANCLHRAIASNLGMGLPGVMQRSRPGTGSMPNGVAIQVISNTMPFRDHDSYAPSSLVVMLPEGTSPQEEEMLLAALGRVNKLYSGSSGCLSVALTGERLDLTRFWEPVPAGYIRLFETQPLFIADSRPPTRKTADGHRWNVDDDACIAIGHVWRNLFPVHTRGDQARLDLAEMVRAKGVRSCGGRTVPVGDIRKYVHRTNKGSFLIGKRALVHLGSIGCDECLAAIGQTRHFGGGLLVPTDLPAALMRTKVDGAGDENE